MQALTVPTTPVAGNIDWPSLAWAMLLFGITLAVLAIKARYPAIARMGSFARITAHACIGYFGVGMVALGLSAIANGSLPVPGGVAWDGNVAIVGGFAALVAGSITLGEHVAQSWAIHRAPASEPEPQPAMARTTDPRA